MKIGTFSKMEFVIPAGELLSLLFRAKQCEIMFAENMANQEKIVRLKKEHTMLKASHERLRKEVREMSVKWSKVAGAEARQPKIGEARQPKIGEDSQPKNKGKANGKKEAK